MSPDHGAVYFCSEEEEVFEAYKLEGQGWFGEGVLIREWAEELAKPSEFNNGVPACPFALPAIEAGQVKTVVSQDLWPEVLSEIASFSDSHYKVSMVFDHDYKGGYSDLEDECMALNNFFSISGIDLWLLAYRQDEAIVFVQRASDLEKAAAKLKELGYYTNYSPADYQGHIMSRKQRRALK